MKHPTFMGTSRVARIRGFVLAAILGILVLRPAAQGRQFYLEFAGGVTRMYAPEDLFELTGSTQTTLSGHGAAGIFYRFGVMEFPIEFQLGLQYRVSTASAGDIFLTMHVPYPVIRIQITKLYASAGASPLVFRRTKDGLGVNELLRADGRIAYMAEAGILWAVAPIFTVGAYTAVQYVTNAGVLSPAPSLDVGMNLRFYFDLFGRGGGGGTSGGRQSVEFQGWRYPFGKF